MALRARRARAFPAVAMVLLGTVVAMGVASCRDPSMSGPGAIATDTPGPPIVPAPPDLTSPRSAVRSYIDWTSLSYRMANSELSTRVADPWEHVRVDSYIQLNREQNRAIEQTLVAFRVVSLSTRDGTATLAARERWRYRYFAIDTRRYLGPRHMVRYETTYTVARQRDGGHWLVSRVGARALDPVR